MSATAAKSVHTLEVDGSIVSLTAYEIGGYNFFGLRDLAEYIGYGVDYDAVTDTALINTK